MKKEALDEGELSKKSTSKEIKQDIHKGNWVKSIVKTGKWYLMASIMTKAIGFFLIPLYTSYLSKADYGVLEILTTINNLLPIVLSFSIDVAFARFFHDYKKDKEKLQTLYSTVFWFVIIVGGGLMVLFLASSFFWMDSLIGIPAFPYAFIAFVPSLFAQIVQVSVRFLEQSLEARTASLITIITSVINIGLSVILLVEFNMGFVARLIGIGGAALVNFIFLVWLFTKRDILKFKFSRSVLRECLYYSMPLILMTASNWINALSDRLIVAKYVSTEAVGLYSLAFQFSMVIYIIGNSVTQVLMPMSMSGLIHDKENTKKKMSDYSSLMWLFMIGVNVWVFLFAKEIVQLMANKSFEAAYVAVPILAATSIFGMQYRFFGVIISFYKKTAFFTITSLSTAIVNLILNFLFVPMYGYIAAVWSTLFCSIWYTGMFIIFGLKLEKLHMKWLEYLLSSIVFILIIVGELQLHFSFWAKAFISIVGSILLILISDKKYEFWNLFLSQYATLKNRFKR